MAVAANTLFPVHPVPTGTDFADLGFFNPFRLEELTSAVSFLRYKEAPGPVGVPDQVLKWVAEVNFKLLHTTFNACITESVFCSTWKESPRPNPKVER